MYASNCNNRGYGLFGGNYQAFWIVVVIALAIIWLNCGCSFGGSSYGGCGCGCDNGCDNGCGC